MGIMLPVQIIALIETLADHTGRSPGTIGREVSGSGDFYPRLKAGHDLTTRRAARVAQKLSDHWPDGTPWPSAIPRPVPSAGSPADREAA